MDITPFLSTLLPDFRGRMRSEECTPPIRRSHTHTQSKQEYSKQEYFTDGSLLIHLDRAYLLGLSTGVFAIIRTSSHLMPRTYPFIQGTAEQLSVNARKNGEDSIICSHCIQRTAEYTDSLR